MNYIITWFIFGIFHLIILTYQDFKNKMWIDQRHNYFMVGLTFGLFVTNSHLNVLFVISIIILLSIFFIFMNKKGLGKGDTQCLTWILFGINFIHINFLIIFVGILVIQIILLNLIMKYILKRNEDVPFMLNILISYIIIGLLILF